MRPVASPPPVSPGKRSQGPDTNFHRGPAWPLVGASEHQHGLFSWVPMRPLGCEAGMSSSCKTIGLYSPHTLAATCFDLCFPIQSGHPGPGLESSSRLQASPTPAASACPPTPPTPSPPTPPAAPPPHPFLPSLPRPPLPSGPPLWNSLAVVFATFLLSEGSAWNCLLVGFLFTHETWCLADGE